MTLRQSIIDHLKKHHGFISSADLHRQMLRLGYRHSTSCGVLSKLASGGQVLRRGSHHQAEVALNRRYKLSDAQKRKIDAHAHLAKEVRQRPVSEGNGIFDICRSKSRIHQLIDIPLQAVRS